MTAPDTVQSERAAPVISPGPLVPVPDFGPVDRLQGWVMTAIIGALAAGRARAANYHLAWFLALNP